MAKLRVTAYPHHQCLAVCAEHAKAHGPVGRRHDNPIVGMYVRIGTSKLSPVFKNARLAKRWAEARYAIKGWYTPPGPYGGSPYFQQYAIPAQTTEEDDVERED